MGPRLDEGARRSPPLDTPVIVKTSSSSLTAPSSCTSRRRPRTTRTTNNHDDSPVVMRMEDGTLTSPFLSTITTAYSTTPKVSIAYSRAGRSSSHKQQEQQEQQQSRTPLKSMMVGNEQESSSLLMEPHSSSLLDNEPQHHEALVPQRRRLFPGSSSSSSQNQPSQQHPPSPWLILAWSLHFISSILVLIYGTYANREERKYVPVDVTKLETNDEELQCQKAFVNVFSTSFHDPEAFVCCRNLLETNYDSNPRICIPPPSYLPFSRRLAKFPDAWILPLFPLFVRGAVHWYYNRSRRVDTTSTGIGSALSLSSQSRLLDNIYSQRRLYLYLALIQMRGWIFYVGLDGLEDWFVSSGGEGCWYERYLVPSNYQQCQGRQMDFSDHVVLYFAQIIPIALVEIMHALFPPGGSQHNYYWSPSFVGGPRQPPMRGANHIILSTHGLRHRLVPIFLSLWLANLYVVTFLGAYKTAAYFHTGPEVWVGFLITLIVQIPLAVVQSTELFPNQRDYFFGSSFSLVGSSSSSSS